MGVFSFIKLVRWKTFNQNFKSPQEIISKIKPQMNQQNVSASFSFSVLATFIFVVYFVILSFTSKITCQNIQGLSSNNFYTLTPPLN